MKIPLRLLRLAVCLLALGWAGALRAEPKDEVIRPRTAAPDALPVGGRPQSGFNSPLLGVALLLAAAGGWLLWRQRRDPRGLSGREARKLSVAETRSLGNRQYLVVADYDGRKFLLGVCPGRIEMLAPLSAADPDPKP